MSSTRERSLKLLAERDTEIHRLRAEMGVVSQSSIPTTPLLQRNYSRTYSSGSQNSQPELEANRPWHPVATPFDTPASVDNASVITTTPQESKLEHIGKDI